LKEKEKHTERSMLKAVHNYFGDYKYCLKNSFVFRYDWESDYFCVNRDGYSFEVEVKISKADFKNDFKKEKHKLFLDKETSRLTPNRFYYAVPKGLITEADLPPYAGLIIVDGSHAFLQKRAPFIHKKKHDFRKILCDKFYYNWLIQKKKVGMIEHDLEVANNKISNLWINSFVVDNIKWDILRLDLKNGTVVGKQIPFYDKKDGYKLIKSEEEKEFKIKDVKFK
jgi:hypothetical protein